MVAVPAWLAVALGVLWSCSTPQDGPAVEVRREPPLAREISYAPGGLRFADDTTGRLVASLYSFPSDLIARQEAETLLAAVRRLDPERTLLVLTDLPLAERPGLEVLPTRGRSYSPWPRDPLSLVRDGGGRVVVLTRPNAQPTREEDLWMGRELARSLPAELDERWGGVRWTTAPVPFHNGQVLLAGGGTWISLHTVELRALERLRLGRVPVEEFATPAGVDRYMAAVGEAAAELAALYGRPVRFVHPLPAGLTPAARPALMRTLGGGAGFDLDSLLTFLPGPEGGLRALVADLALGRQALGSTTPAELLGFRTSYGLAPAGDRLAGALAGAQATERASGLQGFLDAVAAHLEQQGIAVARLPLLFVPVALLADPRGVGHPDFRITWNNVVVETREGQARAEGFASLLPAGDGLAATAFERAGVRLDLLPPLVRSVILTGGYRCASNHLRERTVYSQRSASGRGEPDYRLVIAE